MRTRTIHRADVVGSMLRPPRLVEARRAMRAGEVEPEDYRAIEDAAVDEAIRIQERAGVDVVTDGEMRRDIFFDFFISGLSGVSFIPAQTIRFHGHREDDGMEVTIPFSVTERIEARACPAVAEFAYARERTSLPVKVTLPSPMMILGFYGDASREAYPDPFDLAIDAAAIVRRWIGELADAGCAYIQIDAPELAEAYVSDDIRKDYAARGIDPTRFLELGTELVAGLAEAERGDALLGMHVCKGNGTQSWIAEGGYDAFAENVFRRAAGYDVFHLEYDDERSGTFEALQHLSDDKIAVLGLVSTKWVALEDPALLRARIEEAARYHPLEHLALAPQCGFASAAETAEARKVTEATQVDKLRLVAEVAHEVWG
jgi:5-methyltetrahydropteroyltriglutamate--homocysteine methyltransferase